MSLRYKYIQWVVQQNLTSQSDFIQIQEACRELGIGFVPVNIIPFTSELPVFDRSQRSIIYGSTTFINLVYEEISLRKGLFFDQESFSFENYVDKWGQHVLNYGASIWSFQELIQNKQFAPDEYLFIRPNDDNKLFAGEVKRFSEIVDWCRNLEENGTVGLSADTKFVLSKPYNIQYEWRLWIVNKKVIAASKYRESFKLKKEEGCPPEVVSFAEERCLQYTPHDIFVMDICLRGDEYFIVEYGCMNGAGFYSAKVGTIVKAVTDFVALST